MLLRNKILFCLLLLALGMSAQPYQHFIIYGQSLSVGHQSYPPLSVESVEGNYMLGNQVWCNMGNVGLSSLLPAEANIAASTTGLPKTRAAMIYGENPLLAAVNHIRLRMPEGPSFIVTSCGAGGRTIEELSKAFYNPVYYAEFTRLLNHAATFSPQCPALFFMQGEYNYTLPSTASGLTVGSKPTGDKNTYKSLFLQMKNNMQQDVMTSYKQTSAPLFFTYQTGAQYTRGTTLAIGMAQLEAANEYDDIICAGPIYPMTDRGGHLDPNGYRWYGEMLGKVYYQTVIERKPFRPLQPMEIMRTDKPNVLKIRFYVPHPPLVFDDQLVEKQTSYGFEVFADGGKKVITKAEIAGDCVVITCLSPLVGNVEVIYAGTANKGHGNLRDSDDAEAFYRYVDLDKKNSEGSYVYPRDASEITLRPAYEPRNAGEVIYDKPYPLHNFCVAFYYKLGAAEQAYRVPHTATSRSRNGEVLPLSRSITIVGEHVYVALPQGNVPFLRVVDLAGKSIAAYTNLHGGETYRISVPKGIYLIQAVVNGQYFADKVSVNP